MSWYTRNLHQLATYWGPPVKNAFGDGVFPSAASVHCHWKEEAVNFITAAGANAVSRAVVFVDVEVFADGFLYKGTITGSPRSNFNAHRIQRVEKQPTLRGDVTAYIAFL